MHNASLAAYDVERGSMINVYGASVVNLSQAQVSGNGKSIAFRPQKTRETTQLFVEPFATDRKVAEEK